MKTNQRLLYPIESRVNERVNERVNDLFKTIEWRLNSAHEKDREKAYITLGIDDKWSTIKENITNYVTPLLEGNDEIALAGLEQNVKELKKCISTFDIYNIKPSESEAFGFTVQKMSSFLDILKKHIDQSNIDFANLNQELVGKPSFTGPINKAETLISGQVVSRVNKLLKTIEWYLESAREKRDPEKLYLKLHIDHRWNTVKQKITDYANILLGNYDEELLMDFDNNINKLTAGLSFFIINNKEEGFGSTAKKMYKLLNIIDSNIGQHDINFFNLDQEVVGKPSFKGPTKRTETENRADVAGGKQPQISGSDQNWEEKLLSTITFFQNFVTITSVQGTPAELDEAVNALNIISSFLLNSDHSEIKDLEDLEQHFKSPEGPKSQCRKMLDFAGLIKGSNGNKLPIQSILSKLRNTTVDRETSIVDDEKDNLSFPSTLGDTLYEEGEGEEGSVTSERIYKKQHYNPTDINSEEEFEPHDDFSSQGPQQDPEQGTQNHIPFKLLDRVKEEPNFSPLTLGALSQHSPVSLHSPAQTVDPSNNDFEMASVHSEESHEALSNHPTSKVSTEEEEVEFNHDDEEEYDYESHVSGRGIDFTNTTEHRFRSPKKDKIIFKINREGEFNVLKGASPGTSPIEAKAITLLQYKQEEEMASRPDARGKKFRMLLDKETSDAELIKIQAAIILKASNQLNISAAQGVALIVAASKTIDATTGKSEGISSLSDTTLADIRVNQTTARDFSKAVQDLSKACGLYSGRINNLRTDKALVGLRAHFFHEEAYGKAAVAGVDDDNPDIDYKTILRERKALIKEELGRISTESNEAQRRERRGR